MKEEVSNTYEAVIGLEIHMQLLTKSKAFSADINEYGGMPNTYVSEISLGHPGTLPRLNEKSIEFAIKLGLAIGSQIRELNEFARKNYFYADLPKGYQITQDKTPICNGGKVKIKLNDGVKTIGITRIHIEEDAGKSIHDQDPFNTLIDLNRCGVPLLEMVTEPDLRSSEEAYQYLTEVRKLVRYLEICDGNMEEGSLRCDANISVRKKGTQAFGTKVEVKNMNSIRNVQRAIEFEISRQIEVLENNGQLFQETRNFDATTGTTSAMRSKEMANDYRYFPEPDLQIALVTEEYINTIKKSMPPLPNELLEKYTSHFKLSEYDASILTASKGVALYYNELVKYTQNYKSAANWVMGAVKSFINEKGLEIEDFPIGPKKLASLIKLIDSGNISNNIAEKEIFPELIHSPEKSPEAIAIEKNLMVVNDSGELAAFIEEVLNRYPDKVEAYKTGKKGLLGLFMGEVMKLSKGKADPKLTSNLLTKALEK